MRTSGDQQSYDFSDWEVIGKGTERVCYKHPDDPRRCVKLSPKSNSKQTHREIRYLNFLKKRGVPFTFIPEFYQVVETKDFIGMEVELVSNRDGTRALNLEYYLMAHHSPVDIGAFKQALEELKAYLLEFNVIPCDLLLSNMLVVEEEEGIRVRLIDGYGAAEFLPFSNYLPVVGRRKIQRKWDKFINNIIEPCIARIQEEASKC